MNKIGLLIATGLTLLLVGCGQAAPEPKLLRTPPSDERVPWEGDSQAIYEENQHLFDYDQEAPLDIEQEERWHYGGQTVYDITYASPMGGRVPATLIVPDGRGPFAGVVVLHGLGQGRHGMESFGLYYARFGAVVILIDAPNVRPEHPLYGEFTPLHFTARDRDEQIQLIMDLRRAVDLLIARPDVDPNRLAYMGASYGGAMGGLLAGIEDRLQAYVLAVGDGGLVRHFAGPHWYKSLYWYAWVDEEWIDAMWPVEPIHYVGHAAPAALLFQNGLYDDSVPPYDSIPYQEAGSEPKTIMWYESSHSLPWQATEDQIKWLERYIGGGSLIFLSATFRPQAVVIDRLLLLWPLLTAATILFLVWDLNRARRTPAPWWGRLLWPLVGLIFGPLGLTAYLLSYRQTQRSPDLRDAMPAWRHALGTTAWSVTGNAAGLTLGLVLVVLLGGSGNAALLAIPAPFVVGLLAFRAPTVALRLGGRYWLGLRRALLAEVISLILALAGMLPLFYLLAEWWFPDSIKLASPLFWFIPVLAAISGAIIAYPFHVWMAHRRFPDRAGAPGSEEETAGEGVVMPSLRNAWGALLLGAVLFGGSMGGIGWMVLHAAEGAITLVPFTRADLGISGVVPQDWLEINPGMFSPGYLDEESLPSALVELMVPDTTLDEIKEYLASQMGIEEFPPSVGTLETAAFTWQLYRVEGDVDRGMLTVLDIALVETEEGVYVVMLDPRPEEHDALYDAVFIPVVKALMPLEGGQGNGDE